MAARDEEEFEHRAGVGEQGGVVWVQRAEERVGGGVVEGDAGDAVEGGGGGEGRMGCGGGSGVEGQVEGDGCEEEDGVGWEDAVGG